MNSVLTRHEDGTAVAYDGERVDLHAHSEHLASYDRIRQLSSEATAAAIANHPGSIEADIENGIQQTEAYATYEIDASEIANQIMQVGNYLTSIRLIAIEEANGNQTKAARLKKSKKSPEFFAKAIKLFTGGDVDVPEFKVPKKIRPFKKLTERELLQRESTHGREVFGPIPEGGEREFFALDKDTWIWHEVVEDQAGIKYATTTRYEVKESGVLKAQDGLDYKFIENGELQDLAQAVRLYFDRVMVGVYGRDPRTGQKLPQPSK